MADFSITETLPIEFPPLVIVDVGAGNYGETNRYQFLVDQGLAEVIGFEPNPDEFEALQKSASPHYHYLPYFVGKGGKAMFYATAMPQCSSIYEPDLDLINQFVAVGRPRGIEGPFSVKTTTPIETVPLDAVIGDFKPDYIKVDVQGAELDVLMGAAATLNHVLVIESEVEFIPLYKNQPLLADIQLYLRETGFTLQKFINIQGRNFEPLFVDSTGVMAISQILWADAIFVRNFMQLEQYSNEQLLKACLLMHELYHSYDFVYWLLRAFDQRQESDLGDRYLEAMSGKVLHFKYMNRIGFD